MQLFLKRLRRSWPEPLRFFGVGEYGEKNWRPHYHLAIFGLSMLDHSWDRFGVVNGGPVYDAWWPWGNVHVGELNHDSAQYICGYVTKKMTVVDDYNREELDGRHPEFVRMSTHPGLGAKTACGIANELMRDGGSRGLARLGDVPHELRIDGKKMPLGKYMRRKLREEVGWTGDTPEEVLIQAKVNDSVKTGADLDREARKRVTSEKKAQHRVSIQRTKGSI